MLNGIQIPESLNKLPEDSIPNNTQIGITANIRRIVARYGVDDDEWAEAISSQYFLLCLSNKLKQKNEDYENLLNKCLSSFRVTYKGQFVLDKDSLLITLIKTRIVECMKNEDSNDSYFRRSAKTRADNIDSQRNIIFCHYGLLIRIVSSEDARILRAINIHV